MMVNISREWYVIFTKPRQEKKAETNLINQGFKIFFPKLRTLKKKRTLLQEKIEPLFPGYIFIQLDKKSNWLKIRSTKGVNKLVEFGGNPAKITLDFINFLKGKCDIDGVSNFEDKPKLNPGDKVNIETGAFAGIEAIFYKGLGKDRVELMMNFASKQTKVIIPFQDLL